MYIERYAQTIKPGETVVDLGSGHNPYPRADVYVDYFLDDNKHREGVSLVKPKKGKFVEWDLNQYPLPFKDNEFDFVICSHILEHITDPATFLKEVQRIGKRGYIETPNKLYEQIFGWGDVHIWFVEKVGHQLVLEKKQGAHPFEQLGRKLYRRNKLFTDLHDKQIESLLTSFYWEDSIDFTVLDGDQPHSWKYIDGVDATPVEVPVRLPFFARKLLKLIKRDNGQPSH